MLKSTIEESVSNRIPYLLIVRVDIAHVSIRDVFSILISIIAVKSPGFIRVLKNRLLSDRM